MTRYNLWSVFLNRKMKREKRFRFFPEEKAVPVKKLLNAWLLNVGKASRQPTGYFSFAQLEANKRCYSEVAFVQCEAKLVKNF